MNTKSSNHLCKKNDETRIELIILKNAIFYKITWEAIIQSLKRYVRWSMGQLMDVFSNPSVRFVINLVCQLDQCLGVCIIELLLFVIIKDPISSDELTKLQKEHFHRTDAVNHWLEGSFCFASMDNCPFNGQWTMAYIIYYIPTYIHTYIWQISPGSVTYYQITFYI
jgi:hypothetical protein